MRFGARRGPRALLLVAMAGAVACGCEAEPSGAGARPDIVLVSIDSLRADHVGAYGYARDTSPTIDRLAAQGARFADAVSSTSWTLPAHAALFTGLYDSAHGLVSDGLRLGPGHVTLAERLRDAGYRTAGFYGGPYLHPTFGLDQGFEVWQSCMTKLPDDLAAGAARREARGGVERAHADVTGPRTLREVTRFLEGPRAPGPSEPLFLFVHLWDVHYDYIPPERLVERFDPGYEGDLRGEDFAHNPRIRPGMPERDLEHLIARYDGEIRFTDAILGRLLERLEARGRLEDALLVVTSDHGDEFFEHGGKGHRRTLFDEVIRVPLVLRWPGRIEGGRELATQARLIDLTPTLLSLADAELSAPVQGRDLSPLLLRGERPPPVPALAELHAGPGVLRALRTPRQKLIVGPRGRAHFDLRRDPDEARPRPGGPAVLRRMQERLRGALARLASLRERLGPRRAVPSRAGSGVRERLRALGYVEGEAPREGAAGS